MKEVERKDTPEVGGGTIYDPLCPQPQPDYPQYPCPNPFPEVETPWTDPPSV